MYVCMCVKVSNSSDDDDDDKWLMMMIKFVQNNQINNKNNVPLHSIEIVNYLLMINKDNNMNRLVSNLPSYSGPTSYPSNLNTLSHSQCNSVQQQ